MNGPRQFQRELNEIADRLRNNVSVLKKEVGAEVVEALIDETPVDRGVARSNNRVRFGSPESGVVPAFAPGRRLGRGETANRSAAMSVARARLRSTPESAALRQTLYVTNNVGYIGRLNDGNSAQTPAGFVERAVDRGQSRANRGIRLRRTERFR